MSIRVAGDRCDAQARFRGACPCCKLRPVFATPALPHFQGHSWRGTDLCATITTETTTSSSKTGHLSYSSTRSTENPKGAPAEMLPWKQAVAKYQEPMLRKSIWQIINTLIPYLSLSGLMIWTLHISYWLTLAVAIAAAGFLMRIFIIFHDCGHGSFFRSQH